MRKFGLAVLTILLLSVHMLNAQNKQDVLYAILPDYVKSIVGDNVVNDTIVYVHIDNHIINSLAVADSIKVEVRSPKSYCTAVSADGSMLHNEENRLYIIHYPKQLKQESVYQHAAFRADNGVAYHLLRNFGSKKDIPEKCCVFTADKQYVKYAYLEEKDGDIYNKYSPLCGDVNSRVDVIKGRKIYDWIQQSLADNHQSVYSIAKVGNVYLVKKITL